MVLGCVRMRLKWAVQEHIKFMSKILVHLV